MRFLFHSLFQGAGVRAGPRDGDARGDDDERLYDADLADTEEDESEEEEFDLEDEAGMQARKELSTSSLPPPLRISSAPTTPHIDTRHSRPRTSPLCFFFPQ